MFLGFPRFSPVFPGVPRFSPVFPGVPRCSPVFSGVPRFSPVFPGFSRCSPVFPGVPRYSPVFPGVPRCSLFVVVCAFTNYKSFSTKEDILYGRCEYGLEAELAGHRGGRPPQVKNGRPPLVAATTFFLATVAKIAGHRPPRWPKITFFSLDWNLRKKMVFDPWIIKTSIKLEKKYWKSHFWPMRIGLKSKISRHSL